MLRTLDSRAGDRSETCHKAKIQDKIETQKYNQGLFVSGSGHFSSTTWESALAHMQTDRIMNFCFYLTSSFIWSNSLLRRQKAPTNYLRQAQFRLVIAYIVPTVRIYFTYEEPTNHNLYNLSHTTVERSYFSPTTHENHL